MRISDWSSGVCSSDLGSVVARQFCRRFEIRPGRWRAAGFGVASGVLNGVSGLGGPPSVFYAVVTGMRPEVARATLIFYFGAVSGLTAAMLTASGLVNADVVIAAVTVAPGLLLGGYAGEAAFRRLGAGHFRHATMGLLILSGLLALAM